jgi:hypothetical protein
MHVGDLLGTTSNIYSIGVDTPTFQIQVHHALAEYSTFANDWC